MEECQKDAIQEIIYVQLIGLRQLHEALEKDEFAMPESVVHARRRLARYFLNNGRKPLIGLNEWVAAMLQPVKTWLPEAEDFIDLEAPLWENNGWSRDSEYFLQAYGRPEDYQELTVLKVLEYCRKNNDQEGYVLFRSFLSDPEWAVVSEEELNQMAASFSDEFLKQQIRACYEPFAEWEQARKCPYCGWSLLKKSGLWHCGHANVCFDLEGSNKWSLQTAEPFPFGKDTRVYRLRPGIHRYTLIPGIPEKRIAENLSKIHRVERYPEQDRFDLAVYLDNRNIYLDVKCFRSPVHLATYIERLGPERLEEFRTHAWFVIPREYARKGYINRVRNRIELQVNVCEEDQLYQLLKEGVVS